MKSETRRTRHATPRERMGFLSSGTVSRRVRRVVSDSWERSSIVGVDPEHLTPRYDPSVESGDLDQTVIDCIDRVMTATMAKIGSEEISLIFAAADGRVIRRMCAHAGLRRRLDRVLLEPGVSYGEHSVGTNGIGTALQVEEPTMIVGAEHFADDLTGFACAGAPVRHPISHQLLGVVDLTCFAPASNPLLMAFALNVAEQIEAELFDEFGGLDIALLRDYLAACRHATGPIVALNERVVMMNDLAQRDLTALDRSALLARTSDAAGSSTPLTVVADLPSGSNARLGYRPTFYGQQLAGGVFRVSLESRAPVRSTNSIDNRIHLAGLGGDSPEWRRTVSLVASAARSKTWVILEGERGVGKLTLARAIHNAVSPAEHVRVLDAVDAAADPEGWLACVEDELSHPGTLILGHLNALGDEITGPLSELLVEFSNRSSAEDSAWVVATNDSANRNPQVESQLVPVFPRTITIDPLRHRIQDVGAMVPILLRRLTRGGELTMSSRALNQLQRNPWPGNTAQLVETLRSIVAAKRVGQIEVEDLPSDCMSVGRRLLSPLEALERDAIVTALKDHNGNKAAAAAHLGMSRATIYRKVREFNIVTDPGA